MLRFPHVLHLRQVAQRVTRISDVKKVRLTLSSQSTDRDAVRLVSEIHVIQHVLDFVNHIIFRDGAQVRPSTLVVASPSVESELSHRSRRDAHVALLD